MNLWFINSYILLPVSLGVIFILLKRIDSLEDALRRLNKHIVDYKKNDRLDADLVKRLTDSYKRLETEYKELRSNVSLRVSSKGPYPEWSVLTYDEAYASTEAYKMDLNEVLKGGRYEDDQWIITLLDPNDVNSRQLDFEGMLEETESLLNDIRGGRRVHLEEALEGRDEAIKERDEAIKERDEALTLMHAAYHERDEALESVLNDESLCRDLEKENEILQNKVDYYKYEVMHVNDIQVTWDRLEARFTDSVRDALRDSDFTERLMNDLFDDALEYLIKEE